jgi:hypothetical protein
MSAAFSLQGEMLLTLVVWVSVLVVLIIVAARTRKSSPTMNEKSWGKATTGPGFPFPSTTNSFSSSDKRTPALSASRPLDAVTIADEFYRPF